MRRDKILMGYAMTVIFLVFSFSFSSPFEIKDPVPLSKLEPKALLAKGSDWKLAGYVWFDPANKKKMVHDRGEEILYTTVAGAAPLEIMLNEGKALYLEFDYMLSAGGQLTVDWGQNQSLALRTIGASAINDGSNGTLRGNSSYPPRVEAGRDVGLWQHAQIWLSADGRVYGVRLNGVTVHQNIRLKQLSESKKWNIIFQSEGPVALRNLQYTISDKSDERLEAVFDFPTERKIIVKPEDDPIVQRCFIEDSTFKRTYCVAVGDPRGIHYVIDQTQANVLGVWKGEFYDASTMWISRGPLQVAQPLGSVIWFDGKPFISRLDNPESIWPAGALSGLGIKGYELGKDKRPVFQYSWNGIGILDEIAPGEDAQSLERTLVFEGVNQPGIWLRLAAGREIKQVDKRTYAIDDMKFYITLVLPKNIRPTMRKSGTLTELLIPLHADSQLTYTIKW